MPKSKGDLSISVEVNCFFVGASVHKSKLFCPNNIFGNLDWVREGKSLEQAKTRCAVKGGYAFFCQAIIFAAARSHFRGERRKQFDRQNAMKRRH